MQYQFLRYVLGVHRTLEVYLRPEKRRHWISDRFCDGDSLIFCLTFVCVWCIPNMHIKTLFKNVSTYFTPIAHRIIGQLYQCKNSISVYVNTLATTRKMDAIKKTRNQGEPTAPGNRSAWSSSIDMASWPATLCAWGGAQVTVYQGRFLVSSPIASMSRIVLRTNGRASVTRLVGLWQEVSGHANSTKYAFLCFGDVMIIYG